MLLDLDGTLVDTNYLHTLAWSRALRGAGEDAPMNAIHRLVGMGGDQLVPTLLGHECPDASATRADRYRELSGEIRPLPGASDLLAALHSAGLVVVIATSSPRDELKAPLAALGEDAPIDLVTSADDVSSSKPDPEVFVEAMRSAGLDPGQTVAVGDSIWDVQAARAAGVGCIGVETGGFSRHELGEEGALHVYRDVQELAQQLRTSPIGLLL